MERKIVIDPKDYEKITKFIIDTPIPFERIEEASQVKAILLQKVKTMDIEVKKTTK